MFIRRGFLLLLPFFSLPTPAHSQAATCMIQSPNGVPVPCNALGGGPVAAVTSSAALASSQIVSSTGPVSFFGIQVNTTTPAVFVMAFDATAAPSNGAVTPKGVWQVPANTTLSIAQNPAVTYTTGVVFACSSTGPYTLTLSATCMFAHGQAQ